MTRFSERIAMAARARAIAGAAAASPSSPRGDASDQGRARTGGVTGHSTGTANVDTGDVEVSSAGAVSTVDGPIGVDGPGCVARSDGALVESLPAPRANAWIRRVALGRHLWRHARRDSVGAGHGVASSSGRTGEGAGGAEAAGLEVAGGASAVRSLGSSTGREVNRKRVRLSEVIGPATKGAGLGVANGNAPRPFDAFGMAQRIGGAGAGALTARPGARSARDAASSRASSRVSQRFLPRPDRQAPPRVALDRDLPVLLMGLPGDPLHHSAVGAVRSLGRAGVPVYAVVEDRFTPVAMSCYLTGSIVPGPRHAHDTRSLIERVTAFGETLDTPCLVVCTDDAAAVVVAEHAAALRPRFVLPAVPPELPRRVTDKHWLSEFCRTHYVPAPATALVDTGDDLERAATELRFPLVLKSTASRENVSRNGAPSVGVVRDERELRRLCGRWTEPYRVVVQEYLPDEVCEDWIVHGYCDSRAEVKLAFSGRKVRSWPPRTGATARGFVRTNYELLELTAMLCARIGYRGIFDLGWRFDRRTGAYNLLDFNPRLGAQFRMFDDDAGLDVLRAMHLDMSGRRVPPGRAREHRSFVVEPLDLASRWSDRHRPSPPAVRLAPTGGAHLAWSAWDDPVPVLAMVARQLAQSLRSRLWRRSGSSALPAPGGGGGRAPDPDAGTRRPTRGAVPTRTTVNGASGNGASGNGASGNGASGNGASGNGATPRGARSGPAAAGLA